MVINVNVGLLGHVDSGKTTLAKLLSSVASTASFDHSPQSQQRGITLDLGFSSVNLAPYGRNWQLTLVDCPGHASLLRTVIGGANIIDAVILVVDATKGIQLQTAECLMLAELTVSRLMVALTKVDRLESPDAVIVISKKIQLVLGKTKFKNAPIIPISSLKQDSKDLILDALVRQVITESPIRVAEGPFIMAVDHAFNIKGHGAVLTGTIISGSIHAGSPVIIHDGKGIRKTVKSIQMFRLPVDKAQQGDRIGLGVGSMDTTELDRFLLSTAGALTTTTKLLISLTKLKYFIRYPIKNKSQVTISIIHELLHTKISLFKELNDPLVIDQIDDLNPNSMAILTLARPIQVHHSFLIVGWRQDARADTKDCRLMFSASIVEVDEAKISAIEGSLYRWKTKMAEVDRIVDDHRLIGRGLVVKGGSIQKFLGMQCTIHRSSEPDTAIAIAKGRIESTFGAPTSGKFNVFVSNPLPVNSKDSLQIKLTYKKSIKASK